MARRRTKAGEADRERLLDQLVEHAYRYSEEPRFRLASGRLSNFYIDCKKVTMRHDAARLLARLFEKLVPKSAQAVGGLTMGADPIAYALRDLCRRPLCAFVVRKGAKEHGLNRMIEGPVEPGMNVVVVEDVVTTGGSTIAAITECKRAGLNVVAVLALVDREENNGVERIRESLDAKVPVHAIFTRSDLHSRWLDLQGSAARRRQSRAVAQ
jgi:orotate phosphoribosyltransferase